MVVGVQYGLVAHAVTDVLALLWSVVAGVSVQVRVLVESTEAEPARVIVDVNGALVVDETVDEPHLIVDAPMLPVLASFATV